jgi:RNA polymerase II subunit A-like phosphatase
MITIFPLTCVSSDFALWIKSFGAEVATSVNRRTTHVIANPDRKTTKVKKAARYEHIKIVNPEWMFQCCSRWEHLDETPYLIELDPAERTGSPFADDDSINATGDEDGEELAESPVTLDLSANNWESVDDEFDEFMNETDTDGENESESDSGRSDNSANSKSGPNKKKRKRTNGLVDTSEAEESDSSTTSTSRLQRRKKRTMERVTSLTNVVAAEKSSGLPSPDATGPEEGQGDDDEGASGGKDGGKGEEKFEERAEEEIEAKGEEKIEAKSEEKIEAKGEAPDLQEDYDDGLEAELLAGFGDSEDDEE